MGPMRLFALSRLGLDRDAPEGVLAGLLLELRRTVAAVEGLQICVRDLSVEDAIAPCRAEQASVFAVVFSRVCRPCYGLEKECWPCYGLSIESWPCYGLSKESWPCYGLSRKDCDTSNLRDSSTLCRKAPRLEAVRYVHRRLLGRLLARLREVQDFISLACGPDGKGKISGVKKGWIARLMRESAPLARITGELMGRSAWGKMGKYTIADDISRISFPKGTCVVYVRWNLQNQDTYVGQTSDFDSRIAQHFMKTLKHEVGSYQCKGCSEHAKYLKHRPVKAAYWFMTPLQVCEHSEEAKLLEAKIERCEDPVLNRLRWKPKGELNYELQCRQQNKERRATAPRSMRGTPWKKEATLLLPGSGRLQKGSISYFQMEKGARFFSLDHLLWELQNGDSPGPYQVKYEIRRMTAGCWRRTREVYGDTELEVEGGNITLREWTKSAAKIYSGGIIKIIKIVCSKTDSKRKHEIEELIATGLREATDGKLLLLWHSRKEYQKSLRGAFLKKVWDELERRYTGLTRRPIHLRIPFVHGVDPRMMKMQLYELIEHVGKDWPSYVVEWHKQQLKITTVSRPSVGDIMTNVTRPTSFGKSCVCGQVHQKLRDLGWSSELPKVTESRESHFLNRP